MSSQIWKRRSREGTTLEGKLWVGFAFNSNTVRKREREIWGENEKGNETETNLRMDMKLGFKYVPACYWPSAFLALDSLAHPLPLLSAVGNCLGSFTSTSVAIVRGFAELRMPFFCFHLLLRRRKERVNDKHLNNMHHFNFYFIIEEIKL